MIMSLWQEVAFSRSFPCLISKPDAAQAVLFASSKGYVHHADCGTRRAPFCAFRTVLLRFVACWIKGASFVRRIASLSGRSVRVPNFSTLRHSRRRPFCVQTSGPYRDTLESGFWVEFGGLTTVCGRFRKWEVEFQQPECLPIAEVVRILPRKNT
ncbi:hypothetical protein K458DRAFT_44507 [Lentithecium fluviatile CBS 122367]|uniref:Uncharacterized protein n=1 Tax=Lentithecium fluviatile CBS 122367 TaxID=1168545 RepID=A0A6G1IYF8_9PLEO|nr:hypothetical protein K458DRAFT_44507 [Lentithecium fluviatile CBS 122367]